MYFYTFFPSFLYNINIYICYHILLGGEYNLEDHIVRKVLVFGISLLFVGASVVVPNLNGNITRSSSIQTLKVSTESLGEMIAYQNYSHTVFVGVATSQNCPPCHTWNQDIHDAYVSGLYDFEYVEMIEFAHNGSVLNYKAHDWASGYNVNQWPTSIFDRDYERIAGNNTGALPGALDACGNRTVEDIIANMTLLWLGNATIEVNITVQNNEEAQYTGHILTFITEIVSRYDTDGGDPYHFGFLDFAFDKNISIDAGDEYTDSTVWNGNDHGDAHGDNFGDITEGNIQVTMIVFKNDEYLDETVSARMAANNPPYVPGEPFPPNGATDVNPGIDLSWIGGDPDGDPVTYDVYFNSSSPPSQVAWNKTGAMYDPGILDYETTYYWRIVAWDDFGASTGGATWSFTTTDHTELKVSIIKPMNKSFYLRNIRLFPLPRNIIVYGPIDITVNTTSSVGIESVELYINEKLVETFTEESYSYRWAPILCSRYTIRVIAHDENGGQAEDQIIVFKWRVHPLLILAGSLILLKFRPRILRHLL